MKSRRVWHVPRTRETGNARKIFIGIVNERDNLEGLGVNEKIILEIIFNREGGRTWTGFMQLRIGTGASSCAHGDEPSGSKKYEEFLDCLRDYCLYRRTLLEVSDLYKTIHFRKFYNKCIAFMKPEDDMSWFQMHLNT
jgi:hypothetical protein